MNEQLRHITVIGAFLVTTLQIYLPLRALMTKVHYNIYSLILHTWFQRIKIEINYLQEAYK